MEKKQYSICNKKGDVIGICSDYDGFVSCVKHVVTDETGLEFMHNEDYTDFCATVNGDPSFFPKTVI